MTCAECNQRIENSKVSKNNRTQKELKKQQLWGKIEKEIEKKTNKREKGAKTKFKKKKTLKDVAEMEIIFHLQRGQKDTDVFGK